jgi:hypothetical protein
MGGYKMGMPKGFFASLWDFSFTEFITIRTIRILYGILIALTGIVVLYFIVIGFRTSAAMGILYIILSPFAFFLFVILLRIWLEIVIVIFRIEENTRKLVEKK